MVHRRSRRSESKPLPGVPGPRCRRVRTFTCERKGPHNAKTLARAYFVMGDPGMAVSFQQRAITLTKGADLENDPDLHHRLEEYRKANVP